MLVDGKSSYVTAMVTAQQPKVSSNGLIGWVDCSEEGKPARLHLVQGVPCGALLILRQTNGSLIKILADKLIIEQWDFHPDGKHVVIKSRNLHGPAVIERFSIKDGSKSGSCPAYQSPAPKWAGPYLDN
jgi:hypothetical protein